MSLWIVERVEFQARELDFTSSGLGNHRTTAVIADGTEIINALDLFDSTEDPLQPIVCGDCGHSGCTIGNRVVARRLGDGFLLMPAFEAMARGTIEREEYGPPYFVERHGSAFFRGKTLAELAARIPFFADPERWPALTVREAVLLLQWGAPSGVLGAFPDQPRLCEERIAAASHGAGCEAQAALARALARSAGDARAVMTVPGEPVIFYLDQAGFPEWAPLTFDGTTYRLALAAGLGVATEDVAVDIRREELTSSAANELIAALNAALSALYPEEGANHFRLDAAEVEEGRGAFLVARVDGAPAGCGALRRVDAETAEIKRMYVAPAFRGRGIGARLLAALEAEARRLRLARVVLETGTRQVEALGLYRGAGYAVIPPFGEYVGSPLSVCMEKRL
jgi:putative acetyltransferase